MRKVLILASLLATALTAGCASTRIPGVYRLDVQQGNVITQEQLVRLEPGMAQRKVRFILGSPLLVDVFNEERWDYLYEFRPGGGFGDPVRRRIALYFKGDQLARIDGEMLDAPKGDPDARDRVVTVPDMPRDTGFFSGLNPFKDEPSYASTDATEKTAEPAEAETGTAGADTPPVDPPIAPTVEEQTAPQPAESVTESAPGEDEDGGFFRRLAKRFGFGDEESTAPTAEDAADSAQ